MLDNATKRLRRRVETCMHMVKRDIAVEHYLPKLVMSLKTLADKLP